MNNNAITQATNPSFLYTLELVFFTLMINVLGLALPVAILQIYDRILPNNGVSTLFAICSLVIGAVIAESILKYLRDHTVAHFTARYEYHTTNKIVDNLNRQDIQVYNRTGVGKNINSLTSVDRIKNVNRVKMLVSYSDLPFVFIYGAVIWLVGGALVLAPIAVVSLYLILSIIVGFKTESAEEKSAVTTQASHNFIVQAVSGIRNIKSLSCERQMVNRYERLKRAHVVSDNQSERTNALFSNLCNFFSQVMIVSVVTLGAILYFEGAVTIGAIAASTLIAGRMIAPIQTNFNLFLERRKLAGDIAELKKVLEEAEENRTLKIKDTKTPTLKIENISFDKNNVAIIENFSKTLRVGESIAISGRNGSGKSIIGKLIAGQMRPNSGVVTLNGADVSQLNYKSLASGIAYIPQQGALINGNIIDNITMGDARLRGKAYQVCEELGLNDAISTFPRGYDEIIGDSLHGKIQNSILQKVAIARALTLAPPVIVFDECNSQFDEKSNQLLLEALKRRKQNHILVIISQIPEFINIADRYHCTHKVDIV